MSIKNSLSGFECAVKILGVKIKEAVKGSFASFRYELKMETDTQYKAIKDRIHTLEQSLPRAKDNNTLNDLVTSKVVTSREASDKQFENHIRQCLPLYNGLWSSSTN